MKVLDIIGEKVLIGDEQGNIEEYLLSQMNFHPRIGDRVKVYHGENGLVVIAKDEDCNANYRVEFAKPEMNSYGKVKVNKWLYVLLALLVGGLGVHKFYIGRVGTGILYLLFCWTAIPSIIAFIEGIIAIMAKEDSNGNIWV